ncbi:hypothetical protein PODOV084v1_p0023 [Vibrio phage 340E47.2]|nr:hypothetical protein PODOV084v1_p0023 [Vibrio phage 340E47.2]QZI91928.1 hypothetical protein PODOV077v1_p0017 [Vibrio phage 5P1a]
MLSESQKKKGYFESVPAADFRNDTAHYYNLVAVDGFIKLNHRSRPNMILMTEEMFGELTKDKK